MSAHQAFDGWPNPALEGCHSETRNVCNGGLEAFPIERAILVVERRRRDRYIAWGVSPRHKGQKNDEPRRGDRY